MFLVHVLESGKKDPDPVFPLRCSRESRPPKFSRRYPNTVGFSFPILHPCPTFGESHFTGSSQISYSVSVLPNPATYCAQISDSGNDVPDPDVLILTTDGILHRVGDCFQNIIFYFAKILKDHLFLRPNIRP